MRIFLVAILVVLAFSVAGAHPVGIPHPADRVHDLAAGPKAPPYITNWDGDAYPSTMDCNDDNPAVFPGATELNNGVDDDCDGVIDNGFDTSVEWPKAQDVKLLWPNGEGKPGDDMVSIEATPRIVWAEKSFTVVWIDRGMRLRLARVDADGNLVDNAPPLKLGTSARNPAVAWTGTRYGIVYELKRGDTAYDVHLMTVSSDGIPLADTLVAMDGHDPKIVWGQDRFGVMWTQAFCAGDCVWFQRFGPDAKPIGFAEWLPNSGQFASIAFSGTGILIDATGFDRYDGTFGVAYEGYRGFRVTGEVFLTQLPLEAYYAVPKTEAVNPEDTPYSPLGSRPSVAANPEGFAVCWHEVFDGIDGARLRVFSTAELKAVQEFTPDADKGVASNMVWTGSEFVAVNENIVDGPPAGYDVHFRRVDPSGNTHLAAAWGPWQELNLSSWTPGTVSVHPDIARAEGTFGVVWIEEETKEDPGYGRIWFAKVGHR